MMKGWKSWAAGGSSIAWGVTGFFAGMHEIDAAVAFVSGGLAIIGVAHKVEKLGDIMSMFKKPPVS